MINSVIRWCLKNPFLMLLACAALAAPEGAPVAYQVDGKPYEGFYIAPGKAAGLVLLIHDWDGIGDYEIRRARMLAEAGYAVFAADLFGAGIRPETVAERQELTAALYADRPAMVRLMRGALEAAAKLGAPRANAVAAGYCFGGTAVLELAMAGEPLKGFVSFHGGLAVPAGRGYAATRGSVLVFHGTADDAIPMSDFAALAEALEKYSIPHEMTSYGGAPHAFTVFGTDRYRETADKASWDRFLNYLAATLKP